MNIKNITLISTILLSLTVIIAGGFKYSTSNNIIKVLKNKDINLNKKIFYVIMLIVIVTGFSLRFVYFGAFPYGLHQDEAMAAVDAYALSQHGTDRFGIWLPAHLTAWEYGQMSSLLSYLMVPFIKIFGLNVFSVRLPMAIVNVLSAFAVYKLVKKSINQDVAMITLTFVAINPYFYVASRWSLDCNILPHMFIIGLCFLFYGIEKIRYIYISMIFFALCMYSYGVAFYMVPFFLLASCIYLFVKKYIKVRHILVCLLIYFGISFPIYGTMLINFMKWDTVKLPFTTMIYFDKNTRSSDILFFSQYKLDHLLTNIRRLIEVVFLQRGTLYYITPQYRILYRCSLPLLLLGVVITIYKVIKNNDKKENAIYWLLLFYWITSLALGVFINDISEWRINIIHYCNIIFIGIAVYYIVKQWKLSAIIFMGIYLLQATNFFIYYFKDYKYDYIYFFGNYMETLKYAESIDCEKYYICPPIAIMYPNDKIKTAEMMTMFTQKIDCEYYQGKINVIDGKEIPYKERYNYGEEIDKSTLSDKNSVYVIYKEQLSYFDSEQFDYKVFDEYAGSYAVVTRKQ